jgi:hypothetical protein
MGMLRITASSFCDPFIAHEHFHILVLAEILCFRF